MLKNLLENSEIRVKSAAAWSLVELTNTIPDITPKVFDTLKKLLNNYNDYIQFTVVESLARLVNTTPILAQKVFTILRKLITNPYTNKYVRSKAVSSLASIVQIKPNLAQKIFDILLEEVVHKNNVTPEVITSLGWIVQANPNLAQDGLELLKLLIHKISDFNNYINFTILRSLGWMVQENPNIGQEASKILIKLSNNPDVDVKSEAILILIEIKKVKHTKKLFTDLSEVISDSKNDRYVKHIAAQGLAKISNEMSFIKVGYRNFAELLKITILTENQKLYKNSYPVFKTTLHKITDHITQEYAKRKNPKVIEWFNGCFKEFPNIAETRVFLKEICKTILKSGVINQLESQFILNCVKNYHFTFTVAVNKDHKKIAGKIIFEDRRYEIFQNDNLEEFATMLLAATDDPLAEQYKTHKPLFLNKGLGLKIAASDIMDVNSITNEEAKLSTEAPLLSYVRDIKDNAIILLEKRNVFGNHLIYKFNNNNFEKVAAIYPAEIDEETIKQIFKEIESKKFIQCFVKSAEYFNFNEWQLVNEEGRDLFKDIMEIIQNEKVELETSNFKLLGTEVNIRLNAHENILKDGGIINKAEINREVERLKEENPKLYNYCNALFWNTKNILKACGIAETEFFKNNIKKTIGERIILFGIKFFNPVIKDLPFVGAIADFITDTIEDIICVWLEKRQDRKLKNEIISINDILRHKIGMQDVEDYFKKVAITITHARKNEIINPKEISQPNSLVQKFQACVQEAGNMIYDKTRNILLPEIIESCDKDNKAVQLALKDSIAFINYLYTNYDDILNDDFDLYEQCKKIVKNGTLDALFTQTNKNFNIN